MPSFCIIGPNKWPSLGPGLQKIECRSRQKPCSTIGVHFSGKLHILVSARAVLHYQRWKAAKNQVEPMSLLKLIHLMLRRDENSFISLSQNLKFKHNKNPESRWQFTWQNQRSHPFSSIYLFLGVVITLNFNLKERTMYTTRTYLIFVNFVALPHPSGL